MKKEIVIKLLDSIYQITSIEKGKSILIYILLGVIVLLLVSLFLLFSSLRKLKAQNREIYNFNGLRKAFIDANDNLIYLKDENLKYVFTNKGLECFYNKKDSETVG